MGDVKSNWDNPPVPTPGLDGSGVTASGGDPNIDTGGDGALKPFWPSDKQIMGSAPDGKESANSVSGLPGLPSRFEPSGTPPAPPDLTDRNPGTIDQK
jgi:hypothetical protein